MLVSADVFATVRLLISQFICRISISAINKIPWHVAVFDEVSVLCTVLCYDGEHCWMCSSKSMPDVRQTCALQGAALQEDHATSALHVVLSRLSDVHLLILLRPATLPCLLTPEVAAQQRYTTIEAQHADSAIMMWCSAILLSQVLNTGTQAEEPRVSDICGCEAAADQIAVWTDWHSHAGASQLVVASLLMSFDDAWRS